MIADERLIRVENLVKHFPIRGGFFSSIQEHVRAVDGVSFQVRRAKTLGLVGESGCGKTTVGRVMLGLIPATSGHVFLRDKEVLKASYFELKKMRQEMQIIFQDPFGSLNPRMTVGQIVGEPLRIHRRMRRKMVQESVAGLLHQVGMKPMVMDRYPHEFSGGQRQRIGIARALALEPRFIVCDEPTSALDVSIRAQIINLLKDLQEQRGLSYLMISHDLAVVKHISHEVAVMYLGKIVEQAETEELYRSPRHPYTRVLLSAVPVTHPSLRNESNRVRTLDTDDSVPSPIRLPSGCTFHPRCPLYAALGKPERCRQEVPELIPLNEQKSHLVRCHYPDEVHS